MNPFTTITGSSWVRALRAARVRGEGRSERVLGSFRCPVCARVGIHQPQPDGTLKIVHPEGLVCWWPTERSAA